MPKARRIRTRYHSHPVTGASKITASYGSRQLTIPYPHELDAFDAHRSAAIALLQRMSITGASLTPSTRGVPDRDGYFWELVRS